MCFSRRPVAAFLFSACTQRAPTAVNTVTCSTTRRSRNLYRVIAFDMPYHGRSNPPDGWWLRKYRLTTACYVSTIRAFWQALDLVRPVVMGCSMGGAIVLKIAADYQTELRGVIGLESSAYAPGRYNEYLHHPAIHGGELVASYTYGLCAPTSPEASARENWWYYSQSGPGVYAGDVHYYSIDWDGRDEVKRIDTSRCKVSLLTGSYDYSCTPDMTREVAKSIPGSKLVIMEGMGHFPMIENYPVFRKFLSARARSDGANAMTTFISRRELLRRAGLAGAAAVVAPKAALAVEAQVAAPTRPVAAREAFEHLTSAESNVLEAIVSRLIPTDASGPGATEARAAHYIDRALGNALASSQQAYSNGLAALDRYATFVTRRPIRRAFTGGPGRPFE